MIKGDLMVSSTNLRVVKKLIRQSAASLELEHVCLANISLPSVVLSWIVDVRLSELSGSC